MKIPQTVLIKETNFANAWARAVRYVLCDGCKRTIGDISEPKPMRDACVLFELTGNAIRQIEDRVLHPQFPFQHVGPYCEEFTREYLADYVNRPEDEKFTYIYFERLAMYDGIYDQMRELFNGLFSQASLQIASNRHQAITWDVEHDVGAASPTCLQRIWVRYLGDQSVEVHMDWRSRDLFTAWQANLVALIDMLNREVIRPNNCRIVKLVDYVDSLHIYESDIAAAEDVRLVPVSPQPQRSS